eukprot:9467474-Pyramimonas_sp.AAC.2
MRRRVALIRPYTPLGRSLAYVQTQNVRDAVHRPTDGLCRQSSEHTRLQAANLRTDLRTKTRSRDFKTGVARTLVSPTTRSCMDACASEQTTGGAQTTHVRGRTHDSLALLIRDFGDIRGV